MSAQPTAQDAELILHLYDLRRESVMRDARSFVAQFSPKSLDDVLAVAMAPASKEQAYLRQVVGYWSMAASFVNRGILNREIALDNFNELFFVFVKIQPFLDGFREKMGMPQFARHMQEYVESSPETRDRVDQMKKMQANMASRMEAVGAAR